MQVVAQADLAGATAADPREAERADLLARAGGTADDEARGRLWMRVAEIESDLGRHAEALQSAQQALDILKAPYELAQAEEFCGRMHMASGHYAQVGVSARSALSRDVDWRADDARRRLHAGLINLLAMEAHATGRLDDAERLYAQSLAERRAIETATPTEVLSSLGGLGGVLFMRGQAEDAWPVMLEVVEMMRVNTPLGSSLRLTAYQNLINVAISADRPEDAEKYLSIVAEECRSVDAPFCSAGTMDFMNGVVLTRLGRHLEAEQAYARSISLAEEKQGPDHPIVGQALNNLALVLKSRGADEAAAQAFGRAHAIYAGRAGPLNAVTLRILGNRANALVQAGRAAEAEAELRDALARASGEEDVASSGLGTIYVRLSAALARQSRWEEALAASSQGLTLLGPTADLRNARAAQAAALIGLGRREEALTVQTAALEEARLRYLPVDPDLAFPLAATARLLIQDDQPAAALDLLREASDLLPAWLATQRPLVSVNQAGALTWAELRAAVAELELEALWRLRQSDPDQAEALAETAFSVVQRRLASESALALSLTASLDQAVQPGESTQAVQRLEAARQELRAADDLWARLLGDDRASIDSREKAYRSRSAAEAEYAAAAARLSLTSERFSTLDISTAITSARLSGVLEDDEAVITAVITDAAVHILTLTSARSSWRRVELDAQQICHDIQALRIAIDASRILQCDDAGQAGGGRFRGGETSGYRGLEARFADLDRSRAHEVWKALFGPDQELISDKARLIISTHGPLLSFPLGALVTEPPAGNDSDPADLRRTAWWLKRHAIAMIPEPGLIVKLRDRRNPVSAGFLGIGAPNGGLMPDLPGAEEELRAMAKAVGGPATLLTGASATRSALLAMGPVNRRVVAFATHGLAPGETGAGEHGLLLYPEASQTDIEGALLTASDIARNFLFQTDWVVLSACNTVSLDGTGDAYAGLARAFFASGARGILLSHAPLRDDVAGRLTIATVGAPFGQAKALQQAALALLADESSPGLAHPRHWAVFSVIGDGR